LNIVFNSEPTFKEKWHYFTKNHKLNFHYLIDRLEYLSLLTENYSFLIENKGEVVGVVVLFDRENPAPFFTDKKIESFVYDKIAEIATKNNLKKIIFFSEKDFNFLKYGFFNVLSFSCQVDLRLSQKELWKNLRRRYKSMINKVLKDSDFEIFIMNKYNANYHFHEIYRKLHYKCAGYTRDKKTFDKQFEMLKNGYATLIGLKYQNKFIGMQYFYHFNKYVIYASGADDPEYTEKKFNIYHPILWKAQLYFKEKGYEVLDYSKPCGVSSIQNFDEYLDNKQLNITHFKKGMGAKMIPLYRGVKYYDKNIFEKDLELFENNIRNFYDF